MSWIKQRRDRRAVRAQIKRAGAVFAGRTPTQALLASVCDEPDYGAGLSWAVGDAHDLGLSGDQVRHYSVGVIADLIERGLVTLGDRTSEGFTPWPLTSGEAVIRLDTRWREYSGSWLDEVAWLLATDEGMTTGKALFASEAPFR